MSQGPPSRRDWVINGECLVRVKGDSSTNIVAASDLCLTDKQGRVSISPRWKHQPIHVNDFGPDIPPDVMWQLASVQITMTAVHYDRYVLDTCIAQAMAGISGTSGQSGILVGAGLLMGRGLPLFAPGNHWISLNLLSPQLNFPWRFPTSRLLEPMIPLGVEFSDVRLVWEAIPYAYPVTEPADADNLGEVSSAGLTLWDHTSDT